MEKVRNEKYPRYPSRMAALYVLKTYNAAGHEPIIEVLIDGDIEVAEILKKINENIKQDRL